MTQNESFRRKIIYIVLIVLLLIPLFFISHPSTDKSPGGLLSRMRSEHNLSQEKLGDIDPAGEAMKLSLLGMRGIAANVLWTKANRYKKVEDWTNLSATLEQITKLQPNFVTVWEHQAWNLSYNVSVEFDDYEYRYRWVRRGIEFLMEGTRYNRNEQRLMWYIGWMINQKIGRSDEYKLFRVEFNNDTDFHDVLQKHVPVDEAMGRFSKPDNWLVGRLWYVKAQRVVDTQGLPIKGRSPVLFHASAPMARIYYCMAIEEDGFFDEIAQYEWFKAHEEFLKYGDRDIITSYGFPIQLNQLEPLREEAAELRKELYEVAGVIEAELLKKKKAALSEEEREAIDVPEEERSPEQRGLAILAMNKLKIDVAEFSELASSANQAKAEKLVSQIVKKERRATIIDRYRGIVNFAYWRTRCVVEQRDDAIAAREFLYTAEEKRKKAQLEESREDYEKSFSAWASIYQDYPELMDNVEAEDLVDSIKKYGRVLEQLDDKFPWEFPLKKLLEIQEPEWMPWTESEPPAAEESEETEETPSAESESSEGTDESD